MRILLSTTHGSDNYGAVLQAACLTRSLREFGTVRVLDHRPPMVNVGYDSDCLPYQVLRRRVNPEFPAFLHKRSRMRAAQRALLPLTLPVRARPRARHYEPYDVAVVGSDEIWSAHIRYQPQYFLANAPGTVRRVAYGVSVGRSTGWWSPDEVRAQLSRFNAVLVRDQSTADLCAAAGRPPEDLVCDPVLLADPDDVRAMGSGDVPVSRPYALVYLEACKRVSGIDQALRDAGLADRALSVGFPYPGMEARIDADVRDFVSLVDRAELVVTTMFHGAVTALALGRPVAVSLLPNKSAKLTDLLERVCANEVEARDGYLLVRGTSDIDAVRKRARTALAAAMG
jgi:hypothetical protein